MVRFSWLMVALAAGYLVFLGAGSPSGVHSFHGRDMLLACKRRQIFKAGHESTAGLCVEA